MLTTLNIPNLLTNIKLAPFTTYKIGGPADYYLKAETSESIISAITVAKEAGVPFFILGSGANILIGDKGFRGLVIHNNSNHHDINDNYLTVESGALVADLIELTATHNLSGLEHFAGIPSSVGGAIWQNLHFLSPDRQKTLFISDILTSATILDSELNLLKVDKSYFNFGYDYSVLHDTSAVVLEAAFALTHSSADIIRRQADLNLEWRRQKHPDLIEYPSAGSVFKQIDGIGAGRLIDQAGLRGFKIGGAQVSTKHVNFLVNIGNASAVDVRTLIEVVQDKVIKATGHLLQPEIQFVGEF